MWPTPHPDITSRNTWSQHTKFLIGHSIKFLTSGGIQSPVHIQETCSGSGSWTRGSVSLIWVFPNVLLFIFYSLMELMNGNVASSDQTLLLTMSQSHEWKLFGNHKRSAKNLLTVTPLIRHCVKQRGRWRAADSGKWTVLQTELAVLSCLLVWWGYQDPHQTTRF